MEPFPHYSTQMWELFLFQIKSQNQAKESVECQAMGSGAFYP